MQIQKNISLAKFTTLNIGGPARYFVATKTQQDIIDSISWAKAKNIPYFILGGGSNLLVSDAGFPGLVIKNEVMGITQKKGIIIVQSGTALQVLVNFTVQQGWGFMHKLTRIPGSVGGAVYGNSGAYGQTISDYLTKVVILGTNEARTPESDSGQVLRSRGTQDRGARMTLTREECQFGYRDSIFKQTDDIILEVHFRFEKTDPQALQMESAKVLAQRLGKYPTGLKCPGSFFKNIPIEKISSQSLKQIPKDKITFEKVAAGYLLDEVGAKGTKLGQIEVSQNHGNLLINSGGGKASDFCQLAQNLAQKVKVKFGIDLEPEVQFINLPPF